MTDITITRHDDTAPGTFPLSLEALLARLNPEQLAAVTCSRRHVLMASIPGSGKTLALVARAAWLIRRGLRPTQLVALTFSRKAADELQDRLARLLGDEGRGVWTGTFHAFGASLARQHATLLPRGRTAGFAVMDRDDSRRTVKRLIRDLDLHEDPGDLTELLDRGKRTNGHVLAALPDAMREALTRLVPAYEAVLESRDALDFADLLLVPVRLLETHPDIRHQLQSRRRHILVDEGQDLDVLQQRLVELLVLPVDGYASGDRTSPTLTLAADDDQAVFGFRGGSADYLLRFTQLYPGATVINLGENYRSTPEILVPAGRLIEHNRRRLRKALTTQNPPGPLPEVRQFASDKEEAQYVADRIAQWVAEGLAPVAVLARMSTVLVPIARACEQRGLSVRVTAETPLMERKEVRDLVAYLRVLINPNDWSAFERVMGVPPRGIGARTIAQLQEGVIRQGVETTLAAATRRHKGLAALLALLAAHRVRMRGPAATLRALIEALDYRAYLSRRTEPDEPERRWGHVEELIELADGWERRHGADVREFLDRLVLSEVDESHVSSHQVVGLTLHSAKGLEFDACVIAGVEEGLIPHYRHAAFDDLEEERRLFYVGLTRARTRLLLTVCRERMLWGRPWAFGPSPFLAEARLV
ncbi:MAG: ATP-dependent helicase [Candidatus Rokuibacteriota bacterium]